MEKTSVQFLLSPVGWGQSIRSKLQSYGWKKIAKVINPLNPCMLAIFTIVDFIALMCGLQTSNMQLVFKKRMD